MSGDGGRGTSFIEESIFRNAGQAFSQLRNWETLVTVLQNTMAN